MKYQVFPLQNYLRKVKAIYRNSTLSKVFIARLFSFFFCGYFLMFWSCNTPPKGDDYGKNEQNNLLQVDFRYRPREWQVCFGLKDDLNKSMIANDGGLWYDFVYGNNHIGFPYPNFCYERNKGYTLSITPQLVGQGQPSEQNQWVDIAEIPIIKNKAAYGRFQLHQTTLASFVDNSNPLKNRYDVVSLQLQNKAERQDSTRLRVAFNTIHQIELDETRTKVYLAPYTGEKKLIAEFPKPITTFSGHISKMKYTYYLDFEKMVLAPGDQSDLDFVVYSSQPPAEVTLPLQIQEELAKASAYWEELDLPYDYIKVPDSGIQKMLNASIRGIYQAREIKEGIPAFQVGPTFYRGTWAVDSPFFMEAMTYLGQKEDVRKAIEGIFKFGETQGDTGESFSKQAGLRLWMVWRHAQLTGDSAWLMKMWPFVENEVKNIQRYRQNSYKDGNPLTDGMMPMGNADGGIGGIYAEYTNNYWVLSGLGFAIKMAQTLGKKETTAQWEDFYADYRKVFDHARERDKKMDVHGNGYVPTFMGHNTLNPTTGQWAFMHSIYPGQLYGVDDPLMKGTMAMLDSTLVEGLILGTGWLPKGLWTYSASFHAHAHLWSGNGHRIPQILYDFANHGSPLLNWSEEQHPVDFKGDYLLHGDMPHNWASAEFIRLIRHSLALEREDSLHLFEGMPKEWLKAGKVTSLRGVPTNFGVLSMELRVSDTGEKARLDLDLDVSSHIAPKKIIVDSRAFNNGENLILNYSPKLNIEIDLTPSG